MNDDAELQRIREKMMQEIVEEANSDAPAPGEAHDAPFDISDDEFSTIIQQYPLLVVDCWAPWCAPCRSVAPVIDALAKEYSGKVAFGKLNTDENQRTAAMFGIMSIPTLLLFKDGKLVDKVVGAVPMDQIEGMVRNHM